MGGNLPLEAGNGTDKQEGRRRVPLSGGVNAESPILESL